MATYTIAHQAYLRVALHAAKYPHKQVNGVLLGNETSSGAVQISDAIPLLHHWTSLSPSMEIGLDLARNHAQTLGLFVVGYYQAYEQIGDLSLAPVGERVAETIKRDFSLAVAFVVDGSKLATGEPALIPYLPQGNSSSWRPAVRAEDIQPFTDSSQFKLNSPASPARVLQLILERNMHQNIGDFDDHLEDVTIDWLRNKECKDDLQGDE